MKNVKFILPVITTKLQKIEKQGNNCKTDISSISSGKWTGIILQEIPPVVLN